MFDSIYKSAKEVASDLNPIARNIDKKDKAIIEALFINGIKGKDIIRLVDVYKSDVEAHVEACKHGAKIAKEMANIKSE